MNYLLALFRTARFLAILQTLMLVSMMEIHAAGASPAPMQDRLELGRGFEFGGGYFMPRRGDFRDLYATGYTGVMGFGHELTGNHRLHHMLEVSYVNGSRLKGTFWDASYIGCIEHSIFSARHFALSGGIGPGVNSRWIIFNAFSYEKGEYHAVQHEIALIAAAFINLGCRLGPYTFKLRILYDRPLTGDPQSGDFGDTGGLHFMLVL